MVQQGDGICVNYERINNDCKKLKEANNKEATCDKNQITYWELYSLKSIWAFGIWNYII